MHADARILHEVAEFLLPPAQLLFRLLSIGYVVKGQKDRDFAVPRYSSCVDQNATASDRWELALDLERLELTGAGYDRSERRP
ncbi:MAG TPA: hypothetical protein VHV77_02475 [Pirellulales bacterium]|nr:hypothetical protein [Pirellulales bacterium]